MALPTWNVGVPEYAEKGTYNEKPVPNLSQFKAEVGRGKQRRRTSISIRLITFQFLATTAQKETFFTWFEATLLDGSLDFTTKNRTTGTVESYNFNGEVPPAVDIGYDVYRISISMIRLP